MNRLVDYAAYRKHYGPWDLPDPLIPGRVFKDVRRAKTMGTFRRELLTPLGARALDESRRYLGRLPKFRGASEAGCYFKWEVRSHDEYNALLVFRDWLTDQGIGVTVTESPVPERTVRDPSGVTDQWVPVVHPEGGGRYVKFDLR